MTQTEVNAIKEFAEEHFCDPYQIAEEWEACKNEYDEDICEYLYDLQVTGNYDVFQCNEIFI